MTRLELLGVAEFARRVGMTIGTIQNYSSVGRLPAPDAYINDGNTKVWLPETVDEWNRNRTRR